MSVWLPRRPLPVAHFRAHPTLISHSNRALHVLASRNIIELHPIYTRGPLLLQQQHGLTRRWQSTKETQGSSQTADETRVAAEASVGEIRPQNCAENGGTWGPGARCRPGGDADTEVKGGVCLCQRPQREGSSQRGSVWIRKEARIKFWALD